MQYTAKIKQAVEQANALGYSVSMRSGDGSMVVLVKDTLFKPVSLEINETKYSDLQAELSFGHGLLVVKTGRFAWPHPSFERLFEKQIIDATYLLS